MALVIVDPFLAFLDGEIDVHKDQDGFFFFYAAVCTFSRKSPKKPAPPFFWCVT